MNWLLTNIQRIMIVSGLLTATMFYAAISPQEALLSSFGETIDGPLARLIVRNWGALIGIVGLSLLYGAYDHAARPLALVIAGASKLVFIALVLSNGTRYLSHQAGLAVGVDLVMVGLFSGYLIARRARP